jgi:hypothetical protein
MAKGIQYFLEVMMVKGKLPLLILGILVMAVPLHAKEDMQDKIRVLEQELQKLKELQAQQAVGRQKAEQCLQAVGREKFCRCIGENLPAAVSFEQYVHTVVTSRDELGYSGIKPEQKQVVDDTLAVREKCVENGFFK